MAHKFNRDVEIRSALLHLHSIVSESGAFTAPKAQEAIDKLAADLGRIYDADFSDLEKGDSYGEIEYLRWAVDGCQTLLGFNHDDEMEEALNLPEKE